MDAWSWTYSPDAESLSEIRLMRWEAPVGCDIEKPGGTRRRVDSEPLSGVPSAAEIALKGIIDQHTRLTQISSEVAQAPADAGWDMLMINPRHRSVRIAVEPLVAGEDRTVRCLSRIVHLLGRALRACLIRSSGATTQKRQGDKCPEESQRAGRRRGGPRFVLCSPSLSSHLGPPWGGDGCWKVTGFPDAAAGCR